MPASGLRVRGLRGVVWLAQSATVAWVVRVFASTDEVVPSDWVVVGVLRSALASGDDAHRVAREHGVAEVAVPW